VSTVSRFNRIADKSGIEFHVSARAGAQIDAAEFFTRVSVNHFEKASGNLVDGVRRNLDRLQDKPTVLELNRAKLAKQERRSRLRRRRRMVAHDWKKWAHAPRIPLA
jgi:hypothetical protein